MHKIIFRYCSATQILADDQGPWVKDTQDKVYRILKETPPDGEKFAEAMEVVFYVEHSGNFNLLSLTPIILNLLGFLCCKSEIGSNANAF